MTRQASTPVLFRPGHAEVAGSVELVGPGGDTGDVAEYRPLGLDADQLHRSVRLQPLAELITKGPCRRTEIELRGIVSPPSTRE